MAKIRPHPIWGLGNRQPTDLKKKRGAFGSRTKKSPRGQTEKELAPSTFFRTPSTYTPIMMGGLGDMAPSLNTLNRRALAHIAARERMGVREKDVKRLRKNLGISR